MEWRESCLWKLVGIDFVAVLPFAGQPMKRKERYIARLDEVRITREGDSAVIQYKEAGVPTTHLKIGPDIAGMNDETILELFNDTLRAQAQLAAEYKHVAVEVPLGSPQIKYFARGYQWCPRGGVLRCLVEDDENGQLAVGIDDKELSLEEFGRMLTTYAGWGMRIEFVPDDQLHRRPALEVREPDPENESAEG
jgi:hypothetical protein